MIEKASRRKKKGGKNKNVYKRVKIVTFFVNGIYIRSISQQNIDDAMIVV